MQEVSSLYRSIISGDHYFEISVAIGEKGDLITEHAEKILFGGFAILVARGGPEDGFRESVLKSLKTSTGMFASGNPSVGCAVSGEIDLIMTKPIAEIPRMGQIVPYYRVCNNTEKSEWLKKGVFYIDTREVSVDDTGAEILSLHGYDAMLMAEQEYGTTSLDFTDNAIDTDIVEEIAGKMGVEVDDRTWDIMTNEYRVPYPASYTCREVLQYVAAMYAGSFIMNDIGQLRLVAMSDTPKETRYLIDHAGYTIVFGEDRIRV